MATDVVSVRPDTSVRHAAEIMLARGLSGLPVIDDDGRLAGVITEGDLMRRAELRDALGSAETSGASAQDRSRDYVTGHSWRVGDVMSTPAVAVEETTPLGEIAALFDRRAIKRVPVLRAGVLVGIVSRSDLLRGIVTAAPDRTAAGDAAIRLGIVTRLRYDLGLAEPLPDVVVTRGIVHLSGIVRSETERAAVRVVAEGVRGVAGIDDRLVVQPQEPSGPEAA